MQLHNLSLNARTFQRLAGNPTAVLHRIVEEGNVWYLAGFKSLVELSTRLISAVGTSWSQAVLLAFAPRRLRGVVVFGLG